MLKMKRFSTLLLILIILTACGENETLATQSNNQLQPQEQSEQAEEAPEPSPSHVTSFEPQLIIDLNSYKNQLTEEEQPILTALENNLTALVEHDKTVFRSGFVTENLADNMMYYYSEQFQYRFTAIESIEPNLSYGNVHITLLGQRLDTTSTIIEDVKMMYAFRQNDQGQWMIYTID